MKFVSALPERESAADPAEAEPKQSKPAAKKANRVPYRHPVSWFRRGFIAVSSRFRVVSVDGFGGGRRNHVFLNDFNGRNHPKPCLFWWVAVFRSTIVPGDLSCRFLHGGVIEQPVHGSVVDHLASPSVGQRPSHGFVAGNPVGGDQFAL